MDLLLATTLRGLMYRDTWMRFRHVVTAETFPDARAATIYALLDRLHQDGKRNVGEQSLRVAMEAVTRTADRRAELHAAIDRIMEVKRSAIKRADDAIRRYIARGYAEQAILQYQLHCSDAAFDFSVPAALMERARGIVQVSDAPAVAGRRVGLPGDADMARHTVGLGYSPELDRALGGGIGRGELGVLLAPPARGKTSYLISAATYAVKQGEQVLYFTLEIARHKVFSRYFQSLTHLTYLEMLSARELINHTRNNVPGEFHVADYGKTRLTPSLVHAELEMLRSQGTDISYVVIDYAELMDPTGGFGRQGANSRSLGDMTKEIRRVASYFDVPVLTAWQVNRGGSDKHVFLESDISECWEVVKHADIILGLNQGPLELQYNTLRMKVLKQRESPARPLVYLHSDMTRNIVRPLENMEVPGNGNAARQDDSAVESGGGPGIPGYGASPYARQHPGSSGSRRGQDDQPHPAPDLEDGALVPGDGAKLDQRT